MSDTEYFSNCIICGSHRLKRMDRYAGAFLCKCGSCGFIFSLKIPSEEELAEYYKNYGQEEYISPITIKRYNELLDGFEKYRKNNRILDVGCGFGHFLEAARKRGWEVFGTEYTARAVETCEKKGIRMAQGSLANAQFPDGGFDMITSFEVIEHINNPIDDLMEKRRIIRTGGALYITTPNFNSLIRYYLGPRDLNIFYPEHLSYYTPRTIHNLLRKFDFKKEFLRTTGFSYTRVKISKRISDELLVSANNSDEKIREKTETPGLFNMAKVVINSGLSLFGVGDTIKALYKKISDEPLVSANNSDEKIREKTETPGLFNMAKVVINSGLSLFGVGDTIKALYKKT